MFPTFISILDIQSWWEVPSIAHFCSLFRTAFNLLDFDIEDLEEALLTDGTEETSWLQELIVRLLTGCLPNNEISTFNYQMFLRRLFREKCKEHDRYNPFNTDIDFQLLPLRTKVDILHALCDFRLDAEDVLEQLKNLEADSLRVEPLGYDDNKSAYWYFYGTRLYREDFNVKNNRKGKSVWQVVCFTEEDWFQLAKKFKESTSKAECQLYHTLTENFLPELPRLFCEKEQLARKRLLDNQPRRTSSRLDTKRKQETERAEKVKLEAVLDKEKEELKRKLESEKRRQDAYERRSRLREQDNESDNSEARYEMAGNKKPEKKEKQRHNSSSSSSSKDCGSSVTRSSSQSLNRASNEISSNVKSSTASATTVGRQTNNSLASATGQIVIQPVLNTNRKKLKTSLVFRQTDEDLQTGMHKILDYVKNHEDAWPFVDAVEEEYAPNYYSVIRKPMDLQRMEDRLDSGYYKTFARFRGDFQLIIDNCRLYNGVDNEYTEMVGNLLTVFEKATERYLDQVTSSDDEIAVEYPDTDFDEKLDNKHKTINDVATIRKPTLAAQTDKKRQPSVSDDSVSRCSNSVDFSEAKNKKKVSKVKDDVKSKKSTKQSRKKKNTKGRRKSSRLVQSPIKSRSRSRSLSSFSQGDWSDSPPPSFPPSSPESVYNPVARKSKSSYLSEEEAHVTSKGKEKQKDKWRDSKVKIEKKVDVKELKNKERSHSPPKQKDKHNKLRETIEKLKAKSELSNKVKSSDYEDSDDRTKENEKRHDNKNKKYDAFKNKLKSKSKNVNCSQDGDYSSGESVHSDVKKSFKKDKKLYGTKNAAIEALTLATEQTLKDINKWLDDTPRLSEFSSASNSPSHYIGAEEFENIGSKIDNDYRKRLEKPVPRKDVMGKEIKRRTFHRDPTKFLKKREVQRTIDRLQPGKSKGNLLSNVQNAVKVEDVFPLGPLSKIKDTKNSLIVKTAESTPKLSLGSVLDSFGKHKFVDDVKKDDDHKAPVVKKAESPICDTENRNVSPAESKAEKKEVKTDIAEITPGKATPNLSAWFKAFGAPKVPLIQKKVEQKTEGKESEKVDDGKDKVKEEARKVSLPEVSPSTDSPATPQGQPTSRQRKMSTGSTVSERSSFSQDMDSPRIGIDERLGAYPAPYPSPLHRSPSGASPVMASPRPDVSPKSTYPTVNGQIRVGFYQDTVSNKSSPEKTGSPQSPYVQYSEHVYTPASTESTTYSYGNPYYSQLSNYSTSTTPAYNADQSRPPFYDTSKPLTDQYQAKVTPNYSNYQNVNAPGYPTTNYPVCSTSSSPQESASNCEPYQQQQSRLPEKQTPTFPVKKRVYNETDAPSQPNSTLEPETYDRNYEINLISSRQLNQQHQVRPSSRNTPQQYVHQNIPNPRSLSAQNQPASNDSETMRNTNTFPAATNLYSYGGDPLYPSNSSEGPLDLNARPDGADKKLYANMAYMGSGDIGFNKTTAQYGYVRPPKASEPQPSVQEADDMMMRYAEATDYRSADINISQASKTLLAQPEMSIPRPSYTAPSVSHIVDRFPSENMYYADKTLAASHMYNKPIVTNSSSLPIFSQPYGHDIQTSAGGYNRQLTELQTAKPFLQQTPQAQSSQQLADKKSKRRKNAKNPPPVDATQSAGSNQGFQSYSGLKNTGSIEPSAISLKTASVVPGSAFNFGPAPTGLGLSSGLYGDKDTYPNFLEDYRAAPNYYMAAAAAAAHHRSETTDKQVRTAHQTSASTTGSYPFIGAPQPRPPSYPFMSPHQGSPLMDAGSPLYQQYLQAGVLHQGLLGPPGAYPPGYHPALSMRQPFDSMTRPWL
uniref:Bromo domain-containing protein n=1 Tax=Photinus pyralis TaxID=7054 RepID=A0A1Y1K7W9_PHOPY